MKDSIIIFLASLGAMYTAKEIYFILKKAFIILVNAYGKKYDFVICNEKREITAFVILKNKSTTNEEIENINKTLQQNHGYQIYKIKK